MEEHNIGVVTTPRRKPNVTIAATAENLEWLMKAAQCEWDTGVKIDKESIADEMSKLPELSHPCKYQKTSGGKLKIMCSYRDRDGVWKKHQRAVAVNINGDNSTFEAIVRNCEADVLCFYQNYHDTTAHVSEAPAENAAPEG